MQENGLKFNSGFNREPVMRSQHLRNTISVSSRLTNVINAVNEVTEHSEGFT